ncbi:hypothetical protein ACIBG4_17180 [Nonomuraea sp. NPDC050383]|uniref:hypothetical protein n=1 Tax=Nonomuraea sp. NPDC050383 TaxID=3364362 RepID=UPI0037B6DEDB
MDRAVALASLAIAIIIGIPQVYLAWQQVRLAKKQQRDRASNQPQSHVDEAPVPAPAAPLAERPPQAQVQPPPGSASEASAKEESGVSAPASPGDAAVAVASSVSAPYWVTGLQLLVGANLVWALFDIEGWAATPPTTPRGEFGSVLWTFVAAQFVISIGTGMSIYSWVANEGRSFMERDRNLLYLSCAVCGPLVAIALVIVRHGVLL